MSGLLGNIAPEPDADTRAQVAAVANPASAKDAAFFARGTPVPKVPAGLHRIDRPEGTLVTNHGGKAARFANAPVLHDRLLAELLGHQESKSDVRDKVLRGQMPVVVQGVTPKGAVAHESVASPSGVHQAAMQARAAVPQGSINITSLAAALRRRMSQ
jgi:hypothetical protein